MRDKGANIGVLVTEAMPTDMNRMGLKDGVWVCSFEEFKGLCFVLRETVIQVSNAVTSQENKGDKMSMLYDFLTSNTFRMQVEAIVEGFTQMKADLEREKNSMQRIWKQREKQIEKVIVNTIDMYGRITSYNVCYTKLLRMFAKFACLNNRTQKVTRCQKPLKFPRRKGRF